MVFQQVPSAAIYKPPTEECFRLCRSPVAIIEVKREEANLMDHESQLFGYMKERRTNTGVLFNGNVIVTFEKSPAGDTTKRSSDSLPELGDWLRRLACQDDAETDVHPG